MRTNSELSALQDRIDDYPIDWLDDEASLLIDSDIDLIWMSQFLDCFSHSQAVSILKRVRLLSQKYACPIAILEPIVDKTAKRGGNFERGKQLALFQLPSQRQLEIFSPRRIGKHYCRSGTYDRVGLNR